MSARFAVVFGLAFASAPAQVRAPTPTAGLRGGARLYISRLPPILASDEVKKNLMTGLTTTFVLEVTARAPGGRKVVGGAQIAVRYDLWDEKYLITASDAASSGRQSEAANVDRLEKWWCASEFEVARDVELAAGGPWKVEVSLAVLPFSHTEQLDAQRWLADSLREPGPGGARPNEGSAPVRDLLSGLVATSIARRPVLSYRWTVPLETAAP